MSVWRLKQGVTLAKGPELVQEFENGATRTEFAVRGRYSVLIANRPPHGAYVAGYSGRVVKVVCRRERGGQAGTMTITLDDEVAGSPLTNDFDQETLEIDWVEVSKPLESHPKFKDIHAEHKELLAEYATADAERRTKIRETLEDEAGDTEPGPIGTPDESAAVALLLLEKKNAGYENYLEYVPIVSRTRNVSAPSLDEECAAEILTAAALAELIGTAVPESEYLKSCDRQTRSGENRRWQRQEQWKGSDEWDADIYPVGEWPPAEPEEPEE